MKPLIISQVLAATRPHKGTRWLVKWVQLALKWGLLLNNISQNQQSKLQWYHPINFNQYMEIINWFNSVANGTYYSYLKCVIFRHVFHWNLKLWCFLLCNCTPKIVPLSNACWVYSVESVSKMRWVLSNTFLIFFTTYVVPSQNVVCVKPTHVSLGDREDIFLTHLIIIIKSAVSTFPIVVIFYLWLSASDGCTIICCRFHI